MRRPGITYLVALCCFAAALPSWGQRLYKWVDENGVTHYGDSVPPQYAEQDRDILNTQGVVVDREQGLITEEERAEAARLAAIENAEREKKEAAARRDQILLTTYLSVEEIEMLRDRRVELLDARIKVTEQYLNNLRKRLLGLQDEARRYRPYSAEEDAPDIPENLALDISRTVGAINLYEGTLSSTRDEQTALKQTFARDISRFRALKGLTAAEGG